MISARGVRNEELVQQNVSDVTDRSRRGTHGSWSACRRACSASAAGASAGAGARTGPLHAGHARSLSEYVWKQLGATIKSCNLLHYMHLVKVKK